MTTGYEAKMYSDIDLIEVNTRRMAEAQERIAAALERQPFEQENAIRQAVIAEVILEMDRTDSTWSQDERPSFDDYVEDVVRRLLRIVEVQP
jgi:hypothetical protein